jgi:hypothetical protein
MKPVPSILVLLGLDENRKPRAARFDAAQAEIARKAAKAVGLKVGHPRTDEAKALALRLVPGRLYATGKGLVPLVKTATYDELLAKLELEGDSAKTGPAPAASAPGQPGKPAAGAAKAAENTAGTRGTGKATPGDAKPGSGTVVKDGAAAPNATQADAAALWAAITVGSTVIAPEKRPEEDGWWRATVTAVSKDGRNITIRWLEAPRQPPVTLKRQAVALLYPA